MNFKGRLRLPSDTGAGIPVELRLDDIYFELWAENNEELGTWRLEVVQMSRQGGNVFVMDLDGEEMHFVADDPLGFAYDGLSHIEEIGNRLRKKRRFGKRKGGAGTESITRHLAAGMEDEEPESEGAEPAVFERPAATAPVAPPQPPPAPEREPEPVDAIFEPVAPEPISVPEPPPAPAPEAPVSSPVLPPPIDEVMVVEEVSAVSYAVDAVVETPTPPEPTVSPGR